MGTLRDPSSSAIVARASCAPSKTSCSRQTERGAIASIDPEPPACEKGCSGGGGSSGPEIDPSGAVAGRKQPHGPIAGPKKGTTTPQGGETRTGVTSRSPTLPQSQLGQRQRRCRKSRADGLKDVGDAQTPLDIRCEELVKGA
ncbi:hypothetical protein Zmor_002080 [Zophobas morio]|uniref:Uncharacterized protein n=1 Tax=Zophobas morio TaxID=2755281 RepID=A0AA38J0G2_9CUCU|nr:hypothetical protein Zmor_002080 [Zophobas morio]